MNGIPIKILIRNLEKEGKKAVNIKELKAKFKAYDEDKRSFVESHEPLVCCFCQSQIMPGDDIIVVEGDDRIFCCHMCLMTSYGIHELSFQADGVDDDGYREYFTPKTKD
jgi:hypothetical protein